MATAKETACSEIKSTGLEVGASVHFHDYSPLHVVYMHTKQEEHDHEQTNCSAAAR